MADRNDKDEQARAAGVAGGSTDGAAGAVRPRAAGASAGGAGRAGAGQGGDKSRAARSRLIGHNQSLSTSALRGRSRKAAAGEPDGALWAQLTPRDRTVLELVAEHHVLTTEQLRALLFPSISRAQHRLLALTEAGVLWRTQPYRAEGGSKPFHYLLGYRGAELLAAQRGTMAPRPATHADRLRRILESPRLGHLLGVNQFFADLADYCRRSGLGAPFSAYDGRPEGEGLHTWRSEQWITEFYEHQIGPDGYGCWYQDGTWLGFFLEHDTGTEPVRRVVDKLDRYMGADQPHSNRYDPARLAGMVLIWTTSARREQNLRTALQAKHFLVPVATAARDHGDPDGPAGAVWSVVTAVPEHATRVRLGELPARIGGTTDTGAPIVLRELATRRRAVPVLDGDEDDEGTYRDGTTDAMREANRHGHDFGDLVLTDPDTEQDATNPTPRATASPGQRWKRPA
ncbi:replication-relaxation family protein [Saccharomonospora saliphila]|uniref:replication-relaxation family protein n=1 Tax=Saccharomonospora saliphila TaxID=369829 RepID=UPI0018DDA397|nr:replication-relaxation family protein [Saccharomonospora saliphila]